MSTLNSKSTHKCPYFQTSTIRKVFLLNENELHKSKELVVNDRSSTVPLTFISVNLKIYNGYKYRKKLINR